DQRPESRIFLAAQITIDDIREEFGDQIVSEDEVAFNDANSSVEARRRERLGAIVLRDVALGRPDPDQVERALMDAVKRRGISSLPWSDAARRLRARMAFAHGASAEWPDVSDNALAEHIDEWLKPAIGAARSWADLERIDLASALASLMDWKQRRELDE